MKRFFYLLVVIVLSFSCEKDTQRNNENPFLPNYSDCFEVSGINMSFPQYAIL